MFLIIPDKTKCMAKGGECIVKHHGTYVTGLGMVVSPSCNYSIMYCILAVFELRYFCKLVKINI